MSLLAKPWELLDLMDGQAVTFGVLRYELGELTIVARHDGQEKTIPTMRVYVRPGDKSHGLAYWDITSLTLQAQLRPFLDSPATKGMRFTVTARGVRPAKRFQLQAA